MKPIREQFASSTHRPIAALREHLLSIEHKLAHVESYRKANASEISEKQTSRRSCVVFCVRFTLLPMLRSNTHFIRISAHDRFERFMERQRME